jgi:hypothetical protein
MRLNVGIVLAAFALAGCASTPRPQTLVRSTPTDKSRDPAGDAPAPTVTVDPANETNSSASLSSRITKLFTRSDSSDRMPLPRNDQLLENHRSADASQQDLSRDF